MAEAKKGPQPQPGITSIAAYVPGRSSAAGVSKVHKLSSNETPLGASPLPSRPFTKPAPNLSFIRTAAPMICATRSQHTMG